MALYKEVELNNGVIVNYHRIVSLNKITNMSNILEIASYSSENKREEEAEYQRVQKKKYNKEELTKQEQELLDKGINVFMNTEFIQKEYNEKETIKNAYEYLKTLDKYKQAEDV